MKVLFFQYQNGQNNGDVINGCGLFLIINSCNFVLDYYYQMIPAKYYKDKKLQSGAKKLQRGGGAAFSYYKVGQTNHKVGQKKSQSGAGITKWGKNYKVAHNSM